MTPRARSARSFAASWKTVATRFGTPDQVRFAHVAPRRPPASADETDLVLGHPAGSARTCEDLPWRRAVDDHAEHPLGMRDELQREMTSPGWPIVHARSRGVEHAIAWRRAPHGVRRAARRGVPRCVRYVIEVGEGSAHPSSRGRRPPEAARAAVAGACPRARLLDRHLERLLDHVSSRCCCSPPAVERLRLLRRLRHGRRRLRVVLGEPAAGPRRAGRRPRSARAR